MSASVKRSALLSCLSSIFPVPCFAAFQNIAPRPPVLESALFHDTLPRPPVPDFALFHDPAPRPHISDALRLPAQRLPALRLPRTPLGDCLEARQSRQMRRIGLSQSASAPPQMPWNRPPHFPRHSWLSGRSEVRWGIKHRVPAAQGIVLASTARCA